MTAALILQHGDWGPPGLLGEWAADRGLPFEIHRVDLGQPLPEPDGQPFIVSLGSKYSPRDTDVPVVSIELEFIQTAVASRSGATKASVSATARSRVCRREYLASSRMKLGTSWSILTASRARGAPSARPAR